MLACYKSMVAPNHGQLVSALLGYLDNHQLLSASLQPDSNIVVQIGSNSFYLNFSQFLQGGMSAGSFIMMTDSGLARKHIYAERWGRGSVMGLQNGRQLNEKWNMKVSLPTSAAIRVINANHHNRLPCDALRGLSPAPHTVLDSSIHLTQTWLAAGRKSLMKSYDVEVSWWLDWNVIGL